MWGKKAGKKWVPMSEKEDEPKQLEGSGMR